MAAMDLFKEFTSSLDESNRKSLERLIVSTRQELFAARSEDARTRLVHSFMERAKELTAVSKH